MDIDEFNISHSLICRKSQAGKKRETGVLFSLLSKGQLRLHGKISINLKSISVISTP